MASLLSLSVQGLKLLVYYVKVSIEDPAQLNGKFPLSLYEALSY
jgi:hypothetical protein